MTINLNTSALTGSWKTTLVGLVAVVLGVLQGYSGGGGVSGALHDPKVQMLLLLGILGFFSKDFNTTGGTKGVPSTPAALAAANQAPSTENPPKAEPKP